jgi:hypothetical protein
MKALLFTLFLLVAFALQAQHFTKVIKAFTDNTRCDVKSLGSKGSVAVTSYTAGLPHTAVLISRYDTTGALRWAKEFGENGSDYRDFAATSDNNFIATMLATSNSALLFKLNDNGDVLWAKGVTAGNGISNSKVLEVNGGDYMLVGTAGIDFMHSRGYQLRVNATGNLVSFKGFKCTQYDRVSFMNAITTAQGDILMLGNVDTTDWRAIFLLKTTASGTILWGRQIELDTADVYPKQLFETPEGNIQITCWHQSFGETPGDAYVINTDSNGVVQSVLGIDYHATMNSFGGSHRMDDGSMLFTGSEYSGGDHQFLIKIDNVGNVVFTRKYGRGVFDHGTSVTDLQNGDILIGGTTYPWGYTGGGEPFDIALIRTDADGNVPCYQFTGTATTFAHMFNSSPLNFTDTVFGAIHDVTIPTLSVYSDSTLCSSLISGMEETNETFAFLLFPNPVGSELIIECAKPFNSLRVIDITGSVLYSTQPSAQVSRWHLPVAGFAPGIYFAEVKLGDVSIVRKFIKQ